MAVLPFPPISAVAAGLCDGRCCRCAHALPPAERAPTQRRGNAPYATLQRSTTSAEGGTGGHSLPSALRQSRVYPYSFLSYAQCPCSRPPALLRL